MAIQKNNILFRQSFVAIKHNNIKGQLIVLAI